MTLQRNRKIFYSSILVGFVIILAFPDVVFEYTVEFVHSLFEFIFESIHLLIESIEILLDDAIEHLLHTDLKQTQLIVFYIMLLMGIGACYGFLKLSIRFYRYCKNIVVEVWLEEKKFLASYWMNMTLANKVKLLTLLGSIAYLLFLVSF